MPDPALPTDESGTRHRTAERVARQTGHPVVAVSKSMRTIGLYLDGTRHVLEDSVAVLTRQPGLGTLERYRIRLDQLSSSLTALEIENLVTVRDVAAAAQRLEMVRRIAAEIEPTRTSWAPAAASSPCSSTSWSAARPTSASCSSATTRMP
jgi:diadenylate cyclase